MKQAMYYEKKSNGAVLCSLCPHFCTIAEGHHGKCGVRQNIDGELYSLNYQVVSSLALDPIEKKPLARFHPGSSILSAGSVGCNFKCPFCQNYRIAQVKAGEIDTAIISSSELVQKAVETRAMGNIGIAYTYNEPTIWFEYVLDTARLAKEHGLVNVLVTNGFINPEPLKALLPYTDAMNIDLKGYSHHFYKDICGGGLEAVKNTIAIAAQSCHVEVTTLIIPTLNDSPEEIEEMAKWIAAQSSDITLHLSRFFPNYQMRDLPPTPKETLYMAKEMAAKHLEHVYLGNI